MDGQHGFDLQFLFFNKQRDQAGMNVIAVNDIRIKRKDVIFHSLDDRPIEKRPGIKMVNHIQIFLILQEKNRKVIKRVDSLYDINGFLLAVIFYSKTARFYFLDCTEIDGLIKRDNQGYIHTHSD